MPRTEGREHRNARFQDLASASQPRRRVCAKDKPRERGWRLIALLLLTTLGAKRKSAPADLLHSTCPLRNDSCTPVRPRRRCCFLTTLSGSDSRGRGPINAPLVLNRRRPGLVSHCRQTKSLRTSEARWRTCPEPASAERPRRPPPFGTARPRLSGGLMCSPVSEQHQHEPASSTMRYCALINPPGKRFRRAPLQSWLFRS